MPGGVINANFKLRVNSLNDPLVLRFYLRDPTACQREVDIYRFIGGTVPVPEVLYAEPNGVEGLAPFVLLRYIEGIPFRELRRTQDAEAIAEAAHDIGKTLAAIGKYQFPDSGWFGADLKIGGKFVAGPDSVARFCDLCLASPNFLRRAGEDLAQRVHDFAWSWSPRLKWLEAECSLVHSDFGSRNILVRKTHEKEGGTWRVAAIIDWEFAFSGSPLFDVGNFLRYEQATQPMLAPHFSRGFSAGGGTLREDWRQLARVIDLGALCELLTRDELPQDVEAELVDLVRATVEDRDPT
jgi:fructokinase